MNILYFVFLYFVLYYSIFCTVYVYQVSILGSSIYDILLPIKHLQKKEAFDWSFIEKEASDWLSIEKEASDWSYIEKEASDWSCIERGTKKEYY